MRSDQLAINSVTTRHAGLPEALAAYRAAGFDKVELRFPEIRDWLADRPVTALSDLLDEHGVRLVAGFESTLVCFGGDDERRASVDRHTANARLLDAVGGGVMTVGTDGPAGARDDALDLVAAALGRLADGIEGLNVRVAVEFNWSPLVKSFASAVLACEKLGDERIGVLFDFAHYYTTVTKTEDLTPERVRWIRHVHLDDMADKPGDLSNCNSDRVLPGEGVLDLPGLIGRLESGGYGGLYSVELFNDELWALPAADTADRCYRAARKLCADAV